HWPVITTSGGFSMTSRIGLLAVAAGATASTRTKVAKTRSPRRMPASFVLTAAPRDRSSPTILLGAGEVNPGSTPERSVEERHDAPLVLLWPGAQPVRVARGWNRWTRIFLASASRRRPFRPPDTVAAEA